MLYAILTVFSIAGGYFMFRYFLLLYSLEKITEEIQESQKDLSQNQIIHLPVPDKHLGRLICAVNHILEDIQAERQGYEKREKNFQRQIENISHDLRTPLTVILGYLKIMKKSALAGAGSTDLKENLDIIERKADSMNKLVSQFYDFSRLNSQDYKVQSQKIDVSRLLRETLLGNCQVFEKAGLAVHAEIPERPLWGWGEETALERIFYNLLQNAGRYAHTFLHISLREEGEYIAVSFINDTRLLSPEDIPLLFERFYMQDSSRNQGGTGLGLTVAKLLAEQMGGTLEVRLPEGEFPDAPGTAHKLCFELRVKAGC